MKRRDFLVKSAGLTLAPLIASCDSYEELLGIPQTASVDMDPFIQAVQPQRCEQWCWAASIAMIFGYHGHPIAQETIVVATYGAVVCLPAFYGITMAQDLNRSYVDNNGQTFRSTVTGAYDYDAGVRALSNAMIVRELQNNRPLLYGNLSHAMVLFSVDYRGNEFAPDIVGGRVVDPWPTAQRVRALTPAELVAADLGGHLRFLASASVS